jgi:hypothetical protein
MWYAQNKQELEKTLISFIKPNPKKDLHGIIVPHAGYVYSGAIAGKAFSLLQKKEKAIVLAPSHQDALKGIASIKSIKTPLGDIKITPNTYEKLNYEHAIDNQIPFLQFLGYKEVLPLVVGELSNSEAQEIAKDLSKQNIPIIISTDLSHFLSYEQAVKTDKQSIEIIKNLDINRYSEIDACGSSPLLIAMHLCKLKNYKPKLIEYKNSGDVIGDKSQVVGYASFSF